MTTRVLIIHRVADYAAWKRVFEEAEAIRFQAGERDFQVLRHDDDPSVVVHFSTWTSAVAARRFFESDELVRLRASAGVEQPEFHYLDLLTEGLLSRR